MENLDPPSPPQIKDGKMARFYPSRAFILDLGGDGGLLFHFILSKIVALPNLLCLYTIPDNCHVIKAIRHKKKKRPLFWHDNNKSVQACGVVCKK